jgi:glycosyltransferase involved in cell wall biosynthesis
MRLLIVEPNRRTVNIWTALFYYLSREPDIELQVVVPTLSPEAREQLITSRYYLGDDIIHEIGAWFKDLSQKGHSALLILASHLGGLMKRFHPDVVHVIGECGYLAAFQASVYCRRYCPQATFTIFGSQNIHKRYPFPFPWIERYVLKHSDAVFAVGDDHEKVVRLKGFKGPTPRIPLGVDMNIFFPISKSELNLDIKLPRDKFIVGFVGKMLEQKGIYTLIKAFRCLPDDFHLLMIGDGREMKQVQLKIMEFDLARRITHISKVPHERMPHYMNAMDVLVLPSQETSRSNIMPMMPIPWKEQFGRVLVEALACRVPVIGSQSGEIPTVIGPGGLTFPPGDEDALRQLLLKLKDRRELRQQLAQEGYIHVMKNFSWPVVARRMIEQWSHLQSRKKTIRRAEITEKDVAHE